MAKEIFVFGSNLAGRHGAGAAAHAKLHHGAVYGQGEGLQGGSYALPTKDHRLRPLPLQKIEMHVQNFLWCAINHPDLIFNVTRIGCGLAGYKNQQIAPMFRHAPENCRFDKAWLEFVEGGREWQSSLA